MVMAHGTIVITLSTLFLFFGIVYAKSSKQYNQNSYGSNYYPSNNNSYPGVGYPPYPGGVNPPYPNGGNPSYPSGGNPTYPNGGYPQYPDGGKPSYPSGGNTSYPNGGYPQYPSGGKPSYPNGGYPQKPGGGNPSTKPAKAYLTGKVYLNKKSVQLTGDMKRANTPAFNKLQKELCDYVLTALSKDSAFKNTIQSCAISRVLSENVETMLLLDAAALSKNHLSVTSSNFRTRVKNDLLSYAPTGFYYYGIISKISGTYRIRVNSFANLMVLLLIAQLPKTLL